MQTVEVYNESNENHNTYDAKILMQIRDTIEKMNKFNQIEILRIFSKYKNVIINENKYGIHINLTEIPDKIIKELINHLEFVLSQEQLLDKDEQKKENYKNIYFVKDNKDNLL
jgi:hypothetical protein